MRPRFPALLLLVPVLSGGILFGVAGGPTPATAAVTIDGPDVSSYQHPGGASINWAAVARGGHEFAIVKATEGTTYVNKYFRADYAGIRKAGMVRGSYHFAHPAYPLAGSALAQAKFYVSRIGSANTTKTLPPALDLEVTGGLSRPALVTWAQDFLLDVRKLTGRTPMIYTYPWFWKVAIGDAPAFARYPLWMAAYHGNTPDAAATLWQYTAGAKVRGIKGPVDMSKVMADPTTFEAMTDGATPTPWPDQAPTAPVAVRSVPAVNGATVSWLPPDAGSDPISGYTATLTPADGSAPSVVQVGGAHATASFTGLVNGMPYLVSVQARNRVGDGAVAAPTDVVVPQFPTAIAVTGPKVVDYGAAATLQAVVTRVDTGAPLVGVPVTFSTRPVGGAWTSRGTLTTDDAGRVVRTFAPGRHDEMRFSYGGAVGVQPAASSSTVLVRKLVSARLSAATTHLRRSVVLTGHVTPVEHGVRVVSEQKVGTGWRVLQVKRTGSRGGFRFVVTPRHRGVTHYRVVVAATSSRLVGFSAELALRTL